MKSFTIALLVALCASPALGGGFEDGNKLLSSCEGSDPVLKEYCYGYVVGISDTMEGNAINGFRACVRIGVSKTQIFALATGYLKDHPEVRHYGAAGIVAAALAKAFPCEEPQ